MYNGFGKYFENHLYEIKIIQKVVKDTNEKKLLKKEIKL